MRRIDLDTPEGAAEYDHWHDAGPVIQADQVGAFHQPGIGVVPYVSAPGMTPLGLGVEVTTRLAVLARKDMPEGVLREPLLGFTVVWEGREQPLEFVIPGSLAQWAILAIEAGDYALEFGGYVVGCPLQAPDSRAMVNAFLKLTREWLAQDNPQGKRKARR